MGLAQGLSQLNALCHATEGCSNTDQVVDLLLDYHAINGESGSFTVSQDSQLKTRKARSEAKLEQRLRRIPHLGFIIFMLPLGSIGAWLSGLLEVAKNWLLSLGIFLPTIPTAEGNPEAGDVTETASNTHAVFSIPELGIALDTSRIIFLLCIIALLLTFADYTAKVKRARRARRR